LDNIDTERAIQADLLIIRLKVCTPQLAILVECLDEVGRFVCVINVISPKTAES